MTPHQKGIALTGFGGLLLSFDIPLLRLGNGDIWQVQLIRSGLGVGVALLGWGLLSMWRRRPLTLLPGRTGIAVAFLYGFAAICFLISVFNTATANVVFILSFNTMFAALLSWLALGERPARFTVIIMIVMIGGVLLIVGDGIHSGRYLGDLMALAVAFLLAVIITISRANGKDMGFAPMIGGILPALIALAVLLKTGTGMASVGQPWWLILNGAVVIPVSFWCLATGPKYITGPEVAMFYLLETVLAPIWVWTVFGETPTILALIGGTVIIVSLLLHSAWLFQRDRQRQLPRPVNRPRT